MSTAIPTVRHTPRRSVLFMPGANTRALAKAASLACDGLIFDLEDAVAITAKDAARQNVLAALRDNDYGPRERIVRVNALGTPWGADDVAALRGTAIDAVLFPKIDSAAMAQEAAAALRDMAGNDPVPALWVMIESPQSVINLEAICCADPLLAVLVLGTSDLVRDLRAKHLENRESVLYALSRAVNAARAFELEVLDGVHLDFRNLASFRASSEQGRALGFDGRTLIHPGQIEIANEVYGISASEVAEAREILRAWQEAQSKGLGVVDLNGQLIEHMHASDAQRLLALAAAIDAQG